MGWGVGAVGLGGIDMLRNLEYPGDRKATKLQYFREVMSNGQGRSYSRSQDPE